MNKGKKVGLWIRVSTDFQVKRDSPKHHEERGRLYAKMKEWEVVKIYRLEDVSGSSTMDLTQTREMLQDIKDGTITGLIFSKLARLARNTKELLEFSEYFQAYDADLISLQEAIDTSTPAGRLFYTIIAAMAQWEREEISARVAASVPIRAKLGKPLGGAAPYGYQWIDKKLELNEKEAPVRKLMYELFLKHERKKPVARELNELGYRTRKGAKFSSNSITRLLRDPIAKGLRRANYTKSLGKGKQWELKSPDDWIFVKAPRIISDEIWDKVQVILDEQASKNKRKSRKAKYLFTGKTICACGGKMYVPSNHPKYTCKSCRNKIGVDDLEEIFHSQLESFLYSDVEIAKYLGDAQEAIKDKEKLLKLAESEKEEIDRKMKNVMELFHEGKLPKEAFPTHYDPLHDYSVRNFQKITNLAAELDALRLQYVSSDQSFHDARTLHARWGELEFSEKRTIIEHIVESIIIGETEIEINLYYLPTEPPSPPTPSSPNDYTKGTHPQGFIEAINIKLAG